MNPTAAGGKRIATRISKTSEPLTILKCELYRQKRWGTGRGRGASCAPCGRSRSRAHASLLPSFFNEAAFPSGASNYTLHESKGLSKELNVYDLMAFGVRHWPRACRPYLDARTALTLTRAVRTALTLSECAPYSPIIVGNEQAPIPTTMLCIPARGRSVTAQLNTP